MKRNINKSGRIVRAIIGVFSIALSIANTFEDTIVDIGLLVIGAVLVVASVIKFCPLFYFLGIDTNKAKKLKMY